MWGMSGRMEGRQGDGRLVEKLVRNIGEERVSVGAFFEMTLWVEATHSNMTKIA